MVFIHHYWKPLEVGSKIWLRFREASRLCLRILSLNAKFPLHICDIGMELVLFMEFSELVQCLGRRFPYTVCYVHFHYVFHIWFKIFYCRRY